MYNHIYNCFSNNLGYKLTLPYNSRLLESNVFKIISGDKVCLVSQQIKANEPRQLVVASVYTGEWSVGLKHGYGVEDDIGAGIKPTSIT